VDAGGSTLGQAVVLTANPTTFWGGLENLYGSWLIDPEVTEQPIDAQEAEVGVHHRLSASPEPAASYL
jgi:hypothetical protein